MIKSIIFLSLYTAAGLGSWGAYSFISEQDSSLSSLGLIASQLQPSTKTQPVETNPNIIYRWQDYQGNWTYEDQPYSQLNFENYEDELKFLQKLQTKQDELLPTRISDLLDPANPQANDSTMPIIKTIKKLFVDARNIQNLVDTRETDIDEILTR